METLISVIIPAYNAGNYISRCLESIVKCEAKGLEVIVVDDGSKDNTKALCESYHAKYDYITVVSQENQGVSAARNNGIERAKGKYILFLDADDYFTDDSVKWFLDNAKEDDCLVCGSFNYIKTKGRIQPFYLGDFEYNLSDNCVDKLITTIPNAPWGKLYNRDIIMSNNIRFPLGIPYAEDTIFLLKYLKYVSLVETSSKVIYNYNFTDGGSAMWKYYPDFYKYMELVMDEKKELCVSKGFDYDESKDKQFYFNRCLSHYIKNGHKEKLEEVKEAFGIDVNLERSVKTWYKDNLKAYIVYRIKKKLM